MKIPNVPELAMLESNLVNLNIVDGKYKFFKTDTMGVIVDISSSTLTIILWDYIKEVFLGLVVTSFKRKT